MKHFSKKFVISRVFMVKGPEIWFVISKSSLNRGFVKPREFTRNLLGRIQRTRHLVRYTGKFVISEVR